jgi:hypothetical protein
VDHGTVTVQPAGTAGKRHVFLTVAFDAANDTTRHIELVLSERAAHKLGQALISGSLGVTQEFDLSSDGP